MSAHYPAASWLRGGPDGEKRERWLSADAATAAGYTIVDLRNDWTPFLFEEHVDAAGRALPNRYRRVFIGLANDELDGDGQRLEPGAKNYLELYGIFPSLSVIRERFLLDETRTCVVPEDQAAMAAQKVIGHSVPPVAKRNAARMKKTFAELEKVRLAAQLGTLAELAAKQPEARRQGEGVRALGLRSARHRRRRAAPHLRGVPAPARGQRREEGPAQARAAHAGRGHAPGAAQLPAEAHDL